MTTRSLAALLSFFGTLSTVLLNVPLVYAAWSSDPAANLAIADGGAGQVIPLVGSTSDGGAYVAWFDNPSGNYNVYLQRLSPMGDELWPHNGILISDHAQNTALFGWDMIVDSHDNAVLVFSDIRNGGDLDIYGYKIGPAGQFLWGADGVTLSDNPDFEPAPHVAETTDGDFVFVWQRDPSTGDGDIHMQRLSAAGAERFAHGGISVVSETGRDPGFVSLAPSDGGNVILCWLRDIRSFSSPRHIRAQKFSAAGAAVWPSTLVVYDLFSLPLGYGPRILPDGAGGALIYWHRSDGSLYNSFAQHVKTDGTELLPHEGAAVSTTAGMYHINPAMTFDTATGEIFAFWDEENSFQSQWGIQGQKLSVAGARLWGDGGINFLPVNTQYKSFPRSVPVAGGTIVVIGDSPSGTSTDRLIAMRVDTNGNSLWPGSPILVSSAPGGKARYPVSIGSSGSAKVVWEDNRNATTDVYGQNVNPDGTLGLPAAAGRVQTLLVRRSTMTPGDLTLSWTPSCPLGAVDYAIYEGTLGSYASHVMKDCSDLGGDRTEEIHPATNSTYYLVVPYGTIAEGSYGTDSMGSERPAAAPGQRCIPSQVISPCP